MNDIQGLREHLFAQLAELRNTGAGDAEALRAAVSKASAVAELAKTITDTARVEVEYLKASGGGESAFLSATLREEETQERQLPNGVVRVVQHRLKG